MPATKEKIQSRTQRQRLYHPQFLKGLKSVLRDVARGRTQEAKTFEGFAS